MRAAILTLLFFLFACTPSKPFLHRPPPSPEAILNAAPEHLRTNYAVLDKSYITAYGNSQRNSRVHTGYQALTALTPLVTLNVGHDKADGSRFVVVRPGGERVAHVALETPGTFHIFTAAGANVTGPKVLPGGQALYALEGVLGATTTYVPWDQQLRDSPYNVDAIVGFTVNSGLRMVDGMVFAAIFAFGAKNPHQANSRYYHVVANALSSEPNTIESRGVWEEKELAQGVAAIGTTNQSVVATTTGQLVVYSARGGEPRAPDDLLPTPAPLRGIKMLDVEHRVGCPVFISIVQDGYQLLGACPPVEASDRTKHGPMYGLAPIPSLMDAANTDYEWVTWLHQLNAQGVETAVVRLPFSVRQPPIDAANGRVVLAGNGLAAVERGAVLWHRPSANRMRATAYRDGTLAVADGAMLRIFNRDGAELQAFPTIEGEVLRTPPAIAHDGSVWVAGNKHLYVAKP